MKVYWNKGCLTEALLAASRVLWVHPRWAGCWEFGSLLGYSLSAGVQPELSYRLVCSCKEESLARATLANIWLVGAVAVQQPAPCWEVSTRVPPTHFPPGQA